jgi:hypothetical protein
MLRSYIASAISSFCSEPNGKASNRYHRRSNSISCFKRPFLRPRTIWQRRNDMTSTNGSSEAADTSAASGPRDPLQFAHTLVQKFAALSFASQFREQLYAFLQGIFLLGSFYKVRPDEYRQFADLEYWRNVRQKPNERNIMRSLLGFTMRTKEPGREALQNRVYKYARVLEYFYQNDFISDEVPQRLKDGGGIDAIYAALCRNAGMRTGRGASPEGSLAELPRATEDDETTETRAVALQGPLTFDEIDDDGCRSDDDRTVALEGWPRAGQLLVAANHATDTLRAEFRPAKTGPLDRINLKTTLAVEMFDIQLEEILLGKRATIRVIVGSRDNRGWRSVQAVSVLTSYSLEGPWPGQSTTKQDYDEKR